MAGILTVDLLVAILAHVPEGFIEWSRIRQQFQPEGQTVEEFGAEAATRGIAFEQGAFYDAQRVTRAEFRSRRGWCRPQMPPFQKKGRHIPAGPGIQEKQVTRAQHLAALTDPHEVLVIQRLDAATDGYLWHEALEEIPNLWGVLNRLQGADLIGHVRTIVFDPLRVIITNGVADTLERKQRNRIIQQSAERALAEQPFAYMDESEWECGFAAEHRDWLLEHARVIRLDVKTKIAPRVRYWFACAGADLDAARAAAQAQIAASDNGWKPLLVRCGDIMRAGAREGKTSRTQVIARTYLLGPAAHHTHLPLRCLMIAVTQGLVPSFVDPEEKQRVPAVAVERLITDEAARETIAGFTTVKPRDLAVACGVHRTTIRRRLLKIGQSTTQPTWGAVRGQWELPPTYAAFKQILDEKWRVILAANQAARQAQMQRIEEQRARERAAQEALRKQLIATFPDWRHEGRAQQQVTLSIGPANSGKTHAAIERLIAAGSGWYLAPLRLLAYEIADRLNRRGIPCNLLTGEEALPVNGARITAATIEMFNPLAEGDCVIIDEAQMLADPDRGWAWTRALMEARARELHVLGSANAQDIVGRLLHAVGQPFTSHARERLAPLTVAPAPWKFKELPARTILVAFSRARVLELKTALENMQRRVSIVYGALPPEVRRRQADRFAAGATEICVATDAVGMGLNLPADQVCFAETSKYDGRQVRPLTSAEIHQIGGRAGRYGFASAGIIGTLSSYELKFIRERFERDPTPIKRAHVAPSVADLALIPGRLAARLHQWRELGSIPPAMQSAITTADLTDRIDLALMLRPDEEERLGLAAAVKLTNAPTRRDSRTYWRACVMAVLADEPFPLPPPPPHDLAHSLDLDRAEMVIACADLYLWLARTPEFLRHGPAYEDVRAARYALAERIDAALIARLDTRKRCPSCGRILSERHRFRLCDDCYFEQRYQRDAFFYGYDEEP